ncbi:MAG: hypothetical protein J4473_04550 [Candidatus Aenigmarchaeota archaeon]|nr:hypothetical protein [Candidatus Aenigmarchaeota archaeon]
MPKPTGPTNNSTKKLITELKKTKNKLYLDVARHLAMPSRKKKAISLAKISRIKGPVIVTSKVIGNETHKAVEIYAFSYSYGSRKAISKADGKAYTLMEMIENKKTGTLVC